jgi:hypothetical protein
VWAGEVEFPRFNRVGLLHYGVFLHTFILVPFICQCKEIIFSP